MSFDFLTDMALENSEDSINDLYKNTKSKYNDLTEDSPLTVKAQILSTGLASSNEKLIKNGRPKKDENPRIYGYPDFAKNIQQELSNTWADLFIPKAEDILTKLPSGSFMIKFNLELTESFYSSDDIAFYPIDNPVKKEKIMGTPYFSASSIKGLLRWAWQMYWGDEQKNMEKIFFGQRNDDLNDDNASQGYLYTYPLFWDGKIGFEVINPHDRSTMTGTTPIKYEVVQKGGKSTLVFIFINKQKDYLSLLKKAVEMFEPVIMVLLEHSGFSAKRSAGWGKVKAEQNNSFHVVLPGNIVRESSKSQSNDTEELWNSILDENGNLEDINNANIFTTAKLVKLIGISKTQIKKMRKNKDFPGIEQKLIEALEKRNSIKNNNNKEQKESIDIHEKNPAKLFSSLLTRLKTIDVN